MQKEETHEESLVRLIKEGHEWMFKLSLMLQLTEDGDNDRRAEITRMLEQTTHAMKALESRFKELQRMAEVALVYGQGKIGLN